LFGSIFYLMRETKLKKFNLCEKHVIAIDIKSGGKPTRSAKRNAGGRRGEKANGNQSQSDKKEGGYTMIVER
ncbi:MAG: hypothetical protein QGG39_13640, partial [Candidatus Poribacteria bacterium]|nr:hypothetical protein [Candidatus Poribacteria bacterium]